MRVISGLGFKFNIFKYVDTIEADLSPITTFSKAMKALENDIRCRLENLLRFLGYREINIERYVRSLVDLSRKTIKDEKAEAAARVFSALSDPIRIKILKLLSRRRRMCVCELMIALGLSQPAISYHLKLLRGCGLIRPVRSGKWVFYEIASRGLANLIFKLVESV